MHPTTSSRQLQGLSVLYKDITLHPGLGRFRRFGHFWAKKVHDDCGEFLECMIKLEDKLAEAGALGEGQTLLDRPLRAIKQAFPEERNTEIYKLWSKYDETLMNYGQTLCMNAQVMALPHQDPHMAKRLAEFKPPHCIDILENDRFEPTNEHAERYQRPSHLVDMCSTQALPRSDSLTMAFVGYARWIEKNILARARRYQHGRDPHAQVNTDLRLETIVGFLDFVAGVSASLVLAAMMFALLSIGPLRARIAVSWVFGVVFAFLVKMMGTPTRGEIFGATAAFFAVASVFVSSTNNECGCS